MPFGLRPENLPPDPQQFRQPLQGVNDTEHGKSVHGVQGLQALGGKPLSTDTLEFQLTVSAAQLSGYCGSQNVAGGLPREHPQAHDVGTGCQRTIPRSELSRLSISAWIAGVSFTMPSKRCNAASRVSPCR